MGGFERYYGIKSLTFEEGIALPETVRQTRKNKLYIISMCDNVLSNVYIIQNRVREAPELDDKDHSDLIQELAEKVKVLQQATDAAYMVGWR